MSMPRRITAIRYVGGELRGYETPVSDGLLVGALSDSAYIQADIADQMLGALKKAYRHLGGQAGNPTVCGPIRKAMAAAEKPK